MTNTTTTTLSVSARTAFAAAIVSAGALAVVTLHPLGATRWLPKWPLMAVAVGLWILTDLIAYMLASAAMRAGSFRGLSLSQGTLIGVNAILNALAGWVALEWLLPGRLPARAPIPAVVAVLIGTVPLLALHPRWRHTRTVRRLLGLSNWVLPASLPITLCGALFVGISVLGAVLFPRGRWTRLLGWRLDDAWTATFFLKGGLIANANYLRTAFNMGPFVFVHRDARDWHLAHEAGHNLSLAAFGSAFHLIGAIDENWLGSGASAYAERIAESNVPGTRQLTVALWNAAPRPAQRA